MKLIILLPIILTLFFFAPQISYEHQDGCHRWHSCPSDSGSYVCGDLGNNDECPIQNFSTEIPAWVKEIASRWLDGTVTFDKFVNGIKFLRDEGVIDATFIPHNYSSPTFKENMKLYVNNELTDEQFLEIINKWIIVDKNEKKYPSTHSIQDVPVMSENPIYESWKNIRDEIVFVFPDSVEKLVERGYLVKQMQ